MGMLPYIILFNESENVPIKKFSDAYYSFEYSFPEMDLVTTHNKHKVIYV